MKYKGIELTYGMVFETKKCSKHILFNFIDEKPCFVEYGNQSWNIGIESLEKYHGEITRIYSPASNTGTYYGVLIYKKNAIEVTIEDIAEKFNVKPYEIKIVK